MGNPTVLVCYVRFLLSLSGCDVMTGCGCGDLGEGFQNLINNRCLIYGILVPWEMDEDGPLRVDVSQIETLLCKLSEQRKLFLRVD